MSEPVISDEAWDLALWRNIKPTLIPKAVENGWDEEPQYGVKEVQYALWSTNTQEAISAQAELDAKREVTDAIWATFLGEQLERYKKHVAANDIAYGDPIPHCCTRRALEAVLKVTE